jgi:hypothetical protein
MAQAFLREAFDHFKNKVATSGRFVIVEIFDGITYCPATYAENLFTITDRNAGYAGRKLGETKLVSWCLRSYF